MSDESGFVFRDNSLYVMTPSGPIRLTSDASLQPGEFWFEQPATISTTCARCSATIDPDAAEQHHERCFVVGDRVRWTNEHDSRWHAADPRWFEGTATKVYDSGQGTIGVSVRIERGSAQYKPGDHVSYTNAANLSHIQRPWQAVRSCCPGASTGHACGCDPIEARATAYHKLVTEAPVPIVCAHDDDDELQDTMERVEQPAPTLYDGLTLRQCHERWIENALLVEDGKPTKHAMTGDQISAAKIWWSETIGCQYAEQLRARISAAKERERLSVTYCEVDVDE